MSGGEAVSAVAPPLALRIATVYRCVSLISESVATLPLRHEMKVGGIFTPKEDSLTRLLSLQPNEWTSAYDFWNAAQSYVTLYGESYIVPQYDVFNELKRLILIRPGMASPTTRIGEYQVSDTEQGVKGIFREEDIIRLKGMSLDGVNCVSVLRYAANVTSIAATSDRNVLQNFANGGAPLGILTNEKGTPGYGELQTAVLEGAAQRISRALHSGDRLTALGGKWDYIPFTMTAADMQFLESRKFTVQEICRFFGVDPIYVFEQSAQNYKSVEMANVAFFSHTIKPKLRQIENELNRKLHVPGRVRFDLDGIYDTDLNGRMAYIEKRVQTGTMTPNEARALMGLQPVEGGDKIYLSANLKSMNEFIGNGEKQD
ncbi:MAG: phage portal protein [Candidatus Amulumruptor caecigallinarius]|nr:phage portal protein [Candidatus Amulumruptor caecigallinarius]